MMLNLVLLDHLETFFHGISISNRFPLVMASLKFMPLGKYIFSQRYKYVKHQS
jgi:hypothetical protein